MSILLLSVRNLALVTRHRREPGPMIIARLYTDHQFSTTVKALDLFATLERNAGALPLGRFGAYEPLRSVYDASSLPKACEMLVGGGRSGDILLKGSKNRFMCWIRWRTNGVSEWVFWIDDKVFRKAPLDNAFMELQFELVERYSVIFGGIATEAEWHAKNWLVSKDGSEETKLGLDGLDKRFFPGLYWVTFFGHRISTPDIRSMKALEPFRRRADHRMGASAILTSASPFDFATAERERTESSIRDLIGIDHFFDIKEPTRTPDPISF